MEIFDHFRSGRPQVEMDLIFGISDPQNPLKRPETEFGHTLKIDPETLNSVILTELVKCAMYAVKFMIEWVCELGSKWWVSWLQNDLG